MSSIWLTHVMQVYEGSNAEATKALYEHLARLGPAGVIAVNLLRAQKNSARAKVYRGGEPGRGSYRSLAYERKQWSMDQLVQELLANADVCRITWGWGEDPAQEFHNALLYVDLPTGQVSFHTAHRGLGPDYAGKWDGIRGVSPQRICSFAAQLLKQETAPA